VLLRFLLCASLGSIRVNKDSPPLSEMQDMKFPRSVTGVFLLVVGGVLAAAGVLRMLERNEYKSVASVLVPEPSKSSGPYFLLSEFQKIQSRPVLSNAAKLLNLNEKWGNKYNYGRELSDSEVEERIKTHLDLQNVRHTRFIEIITYDDDPIEAAKLANAIAKGYSQFQRAEAQRRSTEAENAGMISDPMVTIMDLALPEMRPVRPNRYVAGVMLGCGMFLLIVGIVFLSGREV